MNVADITSLLPLFNCFSLQTLNEKNLFSNRKDEKYIVPRSQLPALLHAFILHYDILDIEGNRSFRYSTHYYDTAAFDLYHDHRRGKLKRIKIRKRVYVDSNSSFIEIKTRSNKNKTLKERIAGKNLEDAGSLLKNNGWHAQQLKEVLTVDYTRITLLHKQENEKITIDTNLTFTCNGNIKTFDSLIFLECKTPHKRPTLLSSIMKSKGFNPGSLSKYCLGITAFYPGIRKNNFIVPLKNISKITNHELD